MKNTNWLTLAVVAIVLWYLMRPARPVAPTPEQDAEARAAGQRAANAAMSQAGTVAYAANGTRVLQPEAAGMTTAELSAAIAADAAYRAQPQPTFAQSLAGAGPAY
jgi:hypothetical protein